MRVRSRKKSSNPLVHRRNLEVGLEVLVAGRRAGRDAGSGDSGGGATDFLPIGFRTPPLRAQEASVGVMALASIAASSVTDCGPIAPTSGSSAHCRKVARRAAAPWRLRRTPDTAYRDSAESWTARRSASSSPSGRRAGPTSRAARAANAAVAPCSAAPRCAGRMSPAPAASPASGRFRSCRRASRTRIPRSRDR